MAGVSRLLVPAGVQYLEVGATEVAINKCTQQSDTSIDHRNHNVVEQHTLDVDLEEAENCRHLCIWIGRNLLLLK
jgi:hypothetical protein